MEERLHWLDIVSLYPRPFHKLTNFAEVDIHIPKQLQAINDNERYIPYQDWLHNNEEYH